MNKGQILATLRAHEAELRASGVEELSIFGSAARGDATDESDVDVVVRFGAAAANEGFAYFARLEALGQRLHEILGRPVDVVAEPPRRAPRGDHPARRSAKSAQPAIGVPLPPALSARDATLLRGGADAHGFARSARRLPPLRR